MTEWFSNGEVVAQISASDRGFQYGDGLFETVAIRNGEPRLWNYHIDRLARGCERLGINMPAPAELHDGILGALKQSGVPPAYCVVKIVVSAGATLRGYGRQFVDAPSVLFAAFPAVPPPLESYRVGIEIVLCETRLAGNSATAGLKTLNRLEQVLARSEFIDTDLFEGLTMDADDHIICGTMSNVFVVSGDRLSTPSLLSCGVEGAMRRYIIEMLTAQGIDTTIRAIKLDEMDDMDEVFLCNSQFGVMPVRRCVDKSWSVGDVTKSVMATMAEHGISECRV
jgi:4-amino-4-deoxychorismate lyase